MSSRSEGAHNEAAPGTGSGDAVLVRVGSVFHSAAPVVAEGENVYLRVDEAGRLISREQVSTRPVFDNAATSTRTIGSAGPAVLKHLEASNPGTIDAFIQVFDLATADVTLNVTAPAQSYLVPAGQNGTVRGGYDDDFAGGMKFGTAMTYAVTGGPANSAAVVSGGITINLLFEA